METTKSSLFLRLSPGLVISCARTNNGETINKIRYGSVLVDTPPLHVPYADDDCIKIGKDSIPIATLAAPWNAAVVCSCDKFDSSSESPTPAKSNQNHPFHTSTRECMMDGMGVIPMVEDRSRSCKNCRQCNVPVCSPLR
jgi:hypothetical protein